MKREVQIKITGIQSYDHQQDSSSDRIELVTEGILSVDNGKIIVSYEETELTGLAGTITSFEVEDGAVTLRRSGTVSSCMEFILKKPHQSLYVTEMGTLLITVTARKIENHLDERGGNLTVAYVIDIEDLGMGEIEYQLSVTPLN